MEGDLISKIREMVGAEKVLESEEERKCYAYDARVHGEVPDLVVFPTSREDVAKILSLADRYVFPVIPRGAGSGVTGGCVPIGGGVVLCFTRMDRILEIDEANLIAILEPGVITFNLQEEVKRFGLFYPPDPSSHKYSTIGGNVAECAGGPNSLKYGVTRDYVLGLEVALADGRIIVTGVRTKKGVVGYDLVRLLVGSEGTLGVVTKVILKLLPLPEERATVLALFSTVEDAALAVSSILKRKILPCTMEFMDRASIRCVEMGEPMGIPSYVNALLLMELDGNERGVARDLEKVMVALREEGAKDVWATMDEKERERLWHARRTLSQATYRLNPVKIAEDVVVPQSQVPELIRFLEGLSLGLSIPILSYGHAGDGNFHVSIMIKDEEEEKRRGEEAVRHIFRKTIELGGTISGEHGIGIAKRPFIRMELGEEEIETMLRIKRALDPKNILNPGKIFE